MNINWTKKKLSQLKLAYKKNIKSDSFKIILDPEGEIDILPSYAKYLIEYLETILK